jgi:hypothetical protein
MSGGPNFTVQTTALGYFSIRGPPTDAAGQTYRIFVLPTAHYELPADVTTTLAAAGEPGGSVNLGIFVLTRFAQITGLVTDDLGVLAGVIVHAQQVATVADTAVTGTDGRYTLYVRRGTDYRVYANDVLNHVTPVPNPNPAVAPLTLGAGEVATGIDLFFKAFKVVAGFVRDNNGGPLPSSVLIAFSGDAPVTGGEVLHINKRFYSDLTGAYTAYVPNGNYLVAALPFFGYVGEAVRNLEIRDEGCFLGTDRRVTVDCAHYDWTFTHGVVQGQVVDEAGAGVAAVLLRLVGVTFATATFSDANGYYSIGAPPDDYGIIGSPRDGYTTPIGPALVTLVASATPLVRNILYQRNGTVTGRAVDATTGAGLPGITILVRNDPDGGSDTGTATTGADGSFSVSAPA